MGGIGLKVMGNGGVRGGENAKTIQQTGIVYLVVKIGVEGGKDSLGERGLGIEVRRRVGKRLDGRFYTKKLTSMI